MLNFFLVFIVGVILGAYFPKQVFGGLGFVLFVFIRVIIWMVDLVRGSWRRLKAAWQTAKSRWSHRLDTFRKKLIVLAVVLFYVLWSTLSIMLMVAMGASGVLIALAVIAFVMLFILFLLSDFWGQVAAVVAALGVMLWLGWKAANDFFNGFGNMFAELGEWTASLFTEFFKWIGVALAGLSIALPSCTGSDKVPEPSQVQVTPIPQRFAVGVPIPGKLRVVEKLTAQKAEGCMKITKRGGLPLSLRECRQLAEEYDRKVVHKGKFTLAPNIGRNEEWFLVIQPDGSRKWYIPGKSQKR